MFEGVAERHSTSSSVEGVAERHPAPSFFFSKVLPKGMLSLHVILEVVPEGILPLHSLDFLKFFYELKKDADFGSES